VRAYGTGGSKHHLFLQDEVVRNKVKENIKQGVTASARCISEGLDRHQFPEGWVKKINYR
jgi:hypothetical protein